jgi:hypothetical protein
MSSTRLSTPKSVNARTPWSSRPLTQMTTSSTFISTPSPGQTHAYSEVANEAGIASEGMKWPVGLGCATDAESRAWEALMRA